MAEAGRKLFYFLPQPLGLGILATTRPYGGPRVHPCCPLIFDGHLLAFVIPSPKRNDLHRDGRYALHCYPPAENEDAFYVSGHAELVKDETFVEAARRRYLEEREWASAPDGFGNQELFEFFIENCLLTRTTGHGDPHPQHRTWKARG
jgi:hypothetical protein